MSGQPAHRPEPASTSQADWSLLEVADETELVALLGDLQAAIPEPMLDRILDRFPRQARIHGALIERRTLPPAIALRLSTLVDPALFERLRARHALPAGTQREVQKGLRSRPAWWSQQFLAHFR